MDKLDYDSPEIDDRWCKDQRTIVGEYLDSQRVKHGRIGEWPAWHLAPYVAVWAVESLARQEAIGWWVISGDLPTDYISTVEVEPRQHPRKAVQRIAEHWLELVEAWKTDRDYQGIGISSDLSRPELAKLLESRAKLLMQWANDDSMWEPD